MAESDRRAKAALPEASGASRTAASNPQAKFFKAAEIDVSVPMHEAVYRVMKAIEFGPRTVREWADPSNAVQRGSHHERA